MFNFCYRPLGYRPLVQVLHAAMKSGVASPKPTNKFYSQAKVVKLKIHPRNFSGKEKVGNDAGRVSVALDNYLSRISWIDSIAEDLIVNLDAFAREKFQLFDGTVLEILPTGEKENVPQRYSRRARLCLVFSPTLSNLCHFSTHLLLEVKSLPIVMQPKGKWPAFASRTSVIRTLLLAVKRLLGCAMCPSSHVGAPLSISSEVAQAFKLTGLREVCVRRVDKQSVGLDLMELHFKVSMCSGRVMVLHWGSRHLGNWCVFDPKPS